ncbi:ABC transporter permease [Spirosoma aerolatum]|uniref:ABC transporter permease n=1 Tax=Spirosoma aerolatum TaxID=1211326 RepID=UPI001C54D60A|nr:ABC transporter permease [Spirosoma aerolatum]
MTPPRFATWLLKTFGHPDVSEEVQGDLLELYAHWTQTVGRRKANWRYSLNTLKLLRPLAKRKRNEQYTSPFPLSPTMIRSYGKIAWRSMIRNRSYTLINMVGLTLALGIGIVLFWIVRFEYSFDRYHHHADRLYRIINQTQYGEKGSHVPQGVIKALANQISGIEAAANVYAIESDGVKVGQTLFNVKYIFFSPPQFLDMIDVDWLSGSPKQSLSKPYQVVLDEPTAQRFFGSSNALGKTLRIRNDVVLTVSGIIRKVPVNSEFQFQMLASRETLKRIMPEYQNENYWSGGDSMHHGYVLLKPGTAPSAIEATLAKMLAQHSAQHHYHYTSFTLLPLVDVHRDTQSDADSYHYVLPQWILYTLVGIGLFLILIACINFINLATVQATQRSREIGIRKALGSSRAQLISQFFGETALVVFLGIGLGGLLANQLIRYADQLLNTQVAQSAVWDGSSVVFLLVLGVVTTLLAGVYPALIVSGFQPVRALRGPWFLPFRGLGGVGLSLRQSLVVGQFVIAQILVICTIIGVKQIRYFYQQDLGFDKKAIVTVNMPDRGNAVVRERFRQQLLQHPEIKDVAFGLTTPSSNRQWWWNPVRHPNLPNGEYTFRFQYVDTNYFNFFKIPLIAGRSWTHADTNAVAIINEKAARSLGFQSPERAVGERINLNNNTPFTIMGVVKDYHSQSLRSAIVPHVFLYADWNFQTASIRIDPDRSTRAIALIGGYWKALFPNYYFTPSFLEQDLRSFYEDERKLSNFLTLFAVLGIFIGCLGLFGLVSFVVTQRTREIGVRKVLGATVTSIFTLLSSDFLRLVLIAIVIASPIAYYLMSQFLQAYEYKVAIDWWVFALAGLLAIGIALITVSFQSIKAALANPIKSLRSE